MDKKRTQRIIGILVIMALIIILLPLILGKNEVTTHQATVQAPPLPDQDTQSSPAPDTASTQSTPVEASAQFQPNTTTESALTTPDPTAAVQPNNPISDQQNKLSAQEAPASTQSQPISSAAVESQNPAQQINSTPGDKSSEVVKIGDLAKDPNNFSTSSGEEEKTVTTTQDTTPTAVPQAKTSPTKAQPKMTHHQSLHKYATPMWAVQLGSFKVKTNAEKLVDKLRHSGYKAFSRESHHITKVYVGPEAKHTAATALSSKIKTQLQMQGFVISYKPLEL